MLHLRGRALGLLVALSTSLGCAYLPFQNPHADWTILRSQRFTAYAKADVPAAPTLTMLEQSYAVLQAALFKNAALTPVEVLLVDWTTFRQLFGERRTAVTIGSLPGKGRYGKRGLVVMYQADSTSAGTLHALSHLFLHAAAPRAPLWLHEGLAGYVEPAVVREDERDPGACLGQLPQKQDDLPVADLLAKSWPAFDDARPASPYRFAASNVVDYFFMGESGKLRDKLGDLITLLGEGTPTEAALTKIAPDLTPATLGDKARAHRKAAEAAAARGPCPERFAMPAESFADSAKAKAEPAPAEEIERLFLRLGMLPRRDGQVDWYPPEMIGVEGGQFGKPAVKP